MQKLQYQNRHLQRGYRDTQEGLRLSARNVKISAIALAIGAAFSGLNVGINLLNYLCAPAPCTWQKLWSWLIVIASWIYCWLLGLITLILAWR